MKKGYSILIFGGVFGLTVLSLVADIFLIVNFPNSPAEVKALIDTFSTTWKMGFGAIVGLLAGAIIPSSPEKNDESESEQ
jgi:hypothetical protein